MHNLWELERRIVGSKNNVDYVYKNCSILWNWNIYTNNIYTALFDNVVMISMLLWHNINLNISNGTNKGYFTRVY